MVHAAPLGSELLVPVSAPAPTIIGGFVEASAYIGDDEIWSWQHVIGDRLLHQRQVPSGHVGQSDLRAPGETGKALAGIE